MTDKEKIKILMKAIEPFAGLYSEIHTHNYDDWSMIAKAKGKTDKGSNIKIELAFIAFKNAYLAIESIEKGK